MKFIYIIIAVGFGLLSCSENQTTNTLENNLISEFKEDNKSIDEVVEEDWSYEGETGPEHWAHLSKNELCDGKNQSPINILEVDVIEDPELKPIEFHYSTDVKIHDVTNNGHSIQYDFEKGDFIVVNGKQYHLLQIHFHEASEHTIDGIRYPLEMHMVHVSKDKKAVVLAILAKEGKSSEPFTFLEKYLPVQVGETKIIDTTFDLNQNLPDNRDYFTYSGSLTTPPCSEGVTWYVFNTPITVSVDQVKQLQSLMPVNNFRNEQPINDRVVRRMTNTN